MNYSALFSSLCLSVVVSFGQRPETDTQKDTDAFLTQKPVLFQENKGQFTNIQGEPVPAVLFKASAPGIDSYITSHGLVYVFSKSIRKNKSTPVSATIGIYQIEENALETEWLQVHLEGADIRPENVVKEHACETNYRFFLPHCPGGIPAKEYEKITIREVYPGIDWMLYNSSKTGMKYDFIVHPGADATQIRLVYEGEHPVTLDKKGNIQVQLRWGKLTENAPVSFVGDDRKEIRSAFKSEVIDQNQVRITYAIDTYDMRQTLIIDPQLVWGTLFGGNSEDYIATITHDSNNNIFIAGAVYSVNFPLLDAGTWFQSGAVTNPQAFIAKFDNNGVLLWSTLYGGSAAGFADAITCDGNDNVFIAGHTFASDFPTQNTGTYFQNNYSGNSDLFILKFDNAGNRLWATYYGGNGNEFPRSISHDLTGNVFVTGITSALSVFPPNNTFPLQNAGTYFQAASGAAGDVFILRFDNVGNRLWATLYGGANVDEANSIACDVNGNVFITGTTISTNFPVQNAGTYFDGSLNTPTGDAFILKFDNAGNRLWATYYGGNGISGTGGEALAIDATGNVFLLGYTNAPNLPLQNAGTYFDGTLGGIIDKYILKFDNAGNLLWGTYYGGSASEQCYDGGIAIDLCGNLYVSFLTISNDLQTLDMGAGNYFDGSYNGPTTNIFLSRFTNDGVLSLATYAGGNLYANAKTWLTVDNSNNLFITGKLAPSNTSGDLLVNPGNATYFDTVSNVNLGKGFVFKFAPPVVTFTADDTTICQGSCSSFSANVTTGTNYSWSFGDGTTSTQPNPVHCYTAAGNYDVSLTVTDGSCITQTITRNNYIDVYPSPVVSINANPLATPISAPTVNFTSQSSGAISWLWNFGDALPGQSDAPNAVYTYTEVGDYLASLIVSNAFQCTDTALITITIFEDLAFYAPNAFTPTGDGINDLWIPLGAGIDVKGYDLKIFNRWGELIWQTTDIHEGWDGTLNGQKIPDGTYTWTVRLSSRAIPKEYTGSVTLIR